MSVIHIIGAPAAGKTALRERLAAELGIPSFPIDEERQRILRPGRTWPDDDSIAWLALEEAIARNPDCIIETSGISRHDAELFADVRAFTVLVRCDREMRAARLHVRLRNGGPMVDTRNPQYYFQRLLKWTDPLGDTDARWDGSNGWAGYESLLRQVRSWLSVPIPA